ncbi:Arylsulfatase [Gimesia panareensis]|uniref:Arylsulfatase n=1 Tax=Gimesia panareensis TaxID=2527978 RepID=A0A517QAW4_9PLAN|nr:sulfatase [Gimesia panareensis]QDT28769.1 Arylsulfatase [Gimesia panareensis]
MKAPQLLFVFVAICVPLEVANASDHPNVIMILADDLGYGDLGCFGCRDIKTPNLDRLASQGVRLTSNYSNSSVCSPTRLALLTGRYFQRLGLEWAVWYQAPNEGLPPQESSLASILKQAGYTTALAGKWHLGYEKGWRPNQHGFDYFFGCLGGNVNYFKHYDKTNTHDLFLDEKPLHTKGYVTDLTADYAIKFLEQMKEKPFFLYVAFNAPHFPFQGPEDEDREFSWHEGTRQGQYVLMVESLDRAVGRIVAAIDSNALRDETLIVFTSDNGGEKLARNHPLRGKKGTLWEGGIRVPAIARWPGKIPAGTATDAPVQTIDWSATVLALAGAKAPSNRPLDGVNLMPLLSGKGELANRPLFFRRALDPHRGNVKQQRAVRLGRWKYLDTPAGEQYLFDLDKDISEQTNLIEQDPRRAAKMASLLDQWEADVDPPLYDQRQQARKNRKNR